MKGTSLSLRNRMGKYAFSQNNHIDAEFKRMVCNPVTIRQIPDKHYRLRVRKQRTLDNIRKMVCNPLGIQKKRR